MGFFFTGLVYSSSSLMIIIRLQLIQHLKKKAKCKLTVNVEQNSIVERNKYMIHLKHVIE